MSAAETADEAIMRAAQVAIDAIHEACESDDRRPRRLRVVEPEIEDAAEREALGIF